MKKTNRSNVVKELPRVLLLIVTILIGAVFGLIEPKFYNFNNLMDIICTACIVGIMGLAAMFIMVCGEMDFAMGAEATFAACLLGFILDKGMIKSYVVALIIALAVTIMIGFISSRLVLGVGMPAFITTLAVSKVVDALINYMSNGQTMFSTNWPEAFTFLGRAYVGKIPVLIIVFAMVSFICWLIVDKTKLGKYIFAVGANNVACTQVGINVRLIKTIAFLMCAALAGFSGIIGSSQLYSVTPLLGSGVMMNAMAAALLGATFLRLGQFNVQGTVVAAIMLAMLENGILTIGAPNYVCDIAQGAILTFSVGFIAITRKGGLPGVSFM